MNTLLLNAIILALSGSQDWPQQKYINFCNDINPLICREYIGYADVYPIYDKYIHKLDQIDLRLDEVEK